MIKFILIISLSFNLFATQIDNVTSNFESATAKVLKIVRDKLFNADVRNEKIIQAITPMFDFKLMAKLSLGKKWKSMSKEEQSEFIPLYVKRMKKSYSSKIDKYTDEDIIITNAKQTKKTRIVLETMLVGSQDKLNIVYKYYKPRKKTKYKNKWLIYDIVIDGVSVIKTDKAQFKAVLKNGTIGTLMERLQK